MDRYSILVSQNVQHLYLDQMIKYHYDSILKSNVSILKRFVTNKIRSHRCHQHHLEFRMMRRKLKSVQKYRQNWNFILQQSSQDQQEKTTTQSNLLTIAGNKFKLFFNLHFNLILILFHAASLISTVKFTQKTLIIYKRFVIYYNLYLIPIQRHIISFY